jgi:hypothetical protein
MRYDGDMDEQRVTVIEAARQLGVGTARICQLVKEGRLVKLPYNGKSYDVDVRSLREYLVRRRKYIKRGATA